LSPFWTLTCLCTIVVLAVCVAGIAAVAYRLRRQRDAAEARAAEAERAARRDDTTGLPNRRAFLEHLRQALATGTPAGVVMIDLDGFKAVNDTFGHQTGNALLTAVGIRLADLRPPVRLAARLSGDEFVLLVTGGTEQTRACARAAWRAITSTPIPIQDRTEIQVNASVGYTTEGTSPHDLLRRADMAMYQAKYAGGGVCDQQAATNPPHLPQHERCRDARR
jgi:diguanylate cyclase (GGDEF)-like protein